MKRGLIHIALIAVVGGLAYLVLKSAVGIEVTPAALQKIALVRSYYAEYPWFTLLLFCSVHILAATVCVPGACTLLNIASGAIFGFWQGCAVIYFTTMASAVTGYALGTQFRANPRFQRFRPQAESLLQKSQAHDYFYFVSLRLSPLLPFGLLNLMMGALAIPFGVFFMTTWVGVFFDVVLLNNIGAAAFHGSWGFALSFAALFVALFIIRRVAGKSEPGAAQAQGQP